MDADVLSPEQPLAVAVPDQNAEPLLLALLAACGAAIAWSTGARLRPSSVRSTARCR